MINPNKQSTTSPSVNSEAIPGDAEQAASEQRNKGHRRLELRRQMHRQQELSEINRIIENAWPPISD